jgi:hypothetical protein
MVPEGPRRIVLEEKRGIPAAGWTVRPGALDELPAPAAPPVVSSSHAPTAAATPPAANSPIDSTHRGHEEARLGLDRAKAWLARCEDDEATPAEYGKALETYRRATELFARTNGELNASDESKFLKSQRWRGILAAIVEALKPVPGALAALRAALEHIEVA